jgi:hypothetical protein
MIAETLERGNILKSADGGARQCSLTISQCNDEVFMAKYYCTVLGEDVPYPRISATQ